MEGAGDSLTEVNYPDTKAGLLTEMHQAHESPPRFSIVIPALNEASVIGEVVTNVAGVLERHGTPYEILVIDDGSSDATSEEAAKAGAIVLTRPYNIGNGAAVKHGIRNATGEYIIMMDGDGQHIADDIPRFIEKADGYEMVVGARTIESETRLHRDLANSMYNRMASYIVGHPVQDLTSGFRLINTKVAKKVAYLFPNGFSYPSTCTIALFRAGYSVDYIPITTRARIGPSKIRLLRDGIGFLLILLRIGVLFAPSRIFLPISVMTILPGTILAIYRLILGRPWTIPIVISLTAGLIIFALGLISEQIALLRMSRFD